MGGLQEAVRRVVQGSWELKNKLYYVVRDGDYASSKTQPYFTDEVGLAERMTKAEADEFISQFEEKDKLVITEAA